MFAEISFVFMTSWLQNSPRNKPTALNELHRVHALGRFETLIIVALSETMADGNPLIKNETVPVP